MYNETQENRRYTTAMNMTNVNEIETCFSPALVPYYKTEGRIIVLVDILRATSSICAAFHYGVKEIIPVASVEEARDYKNRGFIVAGERDGKVLDFADFGNSPFNFMNAEIKGKTIAYCTTNGTKAISWAENSESLVIGAYLNFSVLSEWLAKQKKDVLILCSGWKNKFNIEDTLFAGALAAKLLEGGAFGTNCDSVTASVDLWTLAKTDLMKYIDKAAHRTRLKNLGLDDVIEYCHTFDAAPVLPLLKNNTIIA
ncbi:MAG: 2-phosphosulfolactate phosphatase [Bacteroidota bacterium]